MKFAHQMTAQERQQTREQWLDNAAYLASLNRQMAICNHDPKLKEAYQQLSDKWEREYQRLKTVVNKTN